MKNKKQLFPKIGLIISIGLISNFITSCNSNQKQTNKEASKEEAPVEITPELAVKSARLGILNQLPDPANTTFETDSVNQINDTLFSVYGSFTTLASGGGYDKVGFDCKIGLTRDGKSFELVEINTH